MVSTFPTNEFTEVIQDISPGELNDLLDKGESENWKLTLKDEKNDELLIKNKISEDNSIHFIVFKTNTNSALVAVQQLNAQVNNTKLWQYSLFQPEDGESRWKLFPMPEVTLNDFLAEDVKLPDPFENAETSPYLDIFISKNSLRYQINKWNFLKEIADHYQSQDDAALENSYVKYEFNFDWNGTEFTPRKTTLNEYQAEPTASARIVEENPDGPGINEFDCAHGVTVKASAELRAQGANTYLASHVLNVNETTAWAVPDGGIGQSITFTIKENFLIGTTYQIRNGYIKSKDSWKANNRVKKMKVFFNDKHIGYVLLQDSDSYQAFGIDPVWKKDILLPKVGDQIRFEIEEIYKGDKYNDTLISYFVPTGNCG